MKARASSLVQTRNNLSSRAQSRDPVSPSMPPHSISPQPSNRVPHLSAPCAERWETRISTSARHPLLKQDKASRFPKLNYPPLKKPKGSPASRCHPEEAESRTRDSQRRISALSPANQCRRERPRSRSPKQICHPERSRGTLCLSILTPPGKRVPHLSASCAERWEPRISTSAQHPLLKRDQAGRFLILKGPPLKKPKRGAAP
jgi:hypothetical protein